MKHDIPNDLRDQCILESITGVRNSETGTAIKGKEDEIWSFDDEWPIIKLDEFYLVSRKLGELTQDIVLYRLYDEPKVRRCLNYRFPTSFNFILEQTIPSYCDEYIRDIFYPAQLLEILERVLNIEMT